MSNKLSFETRFFIKRWNNSNSFAVRQRILKNQLVKLFLNKELNVFLDEFSSQFTDEERVKTLMLCRKLLAQYPREIDQAHYEAFMPLYTEEIANDSHVDGITWIDEELNYIDRTKTIGSDISSEGDSKVASEYPVAITEQALPKENKKLMTKAEILEEFSWSESTFDRRVKMGFPIISNSKKIYAVREQAYGWVMKKDSRKFQLSISKKAKQD